MTLYEPCHNCDFLPQDWLEDDVVCAQLIQRLFNLLIKVDFG